MCAHPSDGDLPHQHEASFVKTGEQKLTPSQYHLQQSTLSFSPTLKTFVVFQ